MAKEYKYRKREHYHGIEIDIKADTEEALLAKYRKRIAEIERGHITTGGSTTVNRWAEHYFDVYVMGKISDDTYTDRKSLYKNHIRPYIGSLQILSITSGQCQQILNAMDGMSKDRINKCAQLLKRMFKAARKERLIFENPAEDLERPPAEDGEGRAATMQERAMMLMVAREHKAGLWIRTMLYCGFRPGETDRFLGGHINYDHNLLYIAGTKSDAAKRIVPAPAELIAELKDLHLHPNECVFKNAYGDRMRKSSRAKLWNNFKRAMNIQAGCQVYRNELLPPFPIAEDLVPYCCRHTFATDLKDAGIPYRIRQELLGHANATVTDGYTHKTETSLRIATELLKKYRIEQVQEIEKMEQKILTDGYDSEEKVNEILTYKYFPDLL